MGSMDSIGIMGKEDNNGGNGNNSVNNNNNNNNNNNVSIKVLEHQIELLKKENQLLNEIIENVHEVVYATNENGVIILYNHWNEELEGLKKEDVLGRTEEEVYDYQTENFFHEEVTYPVKRTGKPLREYYYKYKLPDGRKTSVILNAYPFYFQGKFSAVYTIARNENQIGEFIARTLERQRKNYLEQNRGNNNGSKFFLEDIVGKSQEIVQAVSVSRKVARHNSPVLIIGETGTGKELFAHGIHNASLHSAGPFVPVNCAAIPETLLESLLFGTVKGAFTGATDIPGLLEQAEGGTIFLDEINSMSMPLQAKLLRVIQDKVVRRIGSMKEISINCRIISATNIDPFRGESDKIIRSDLFFRLATVALNVPPLRERKEDIKNLCYHFIKKYNINFGLFVNKVSDELLSLFQQYSWPGNVRELMNMIESSMNFVEVGEDVIELNHLPSYFKERLLNSKPANVKSPVRKGTLRESLLEFEKEMIKEALHKHKGNISKAAQDLGMVSQNLHYRLKRFGINA